MRPVKKSMSVSQEACLGLANITIASPRSLGISRSLSLSMTSAYRHGQHSIYRSRQKEANRDATLVAPGEVKRVCPGLTLLSSTLPRFRRLVQYVPARSVKLASVKPESLSLCLCRVGVRPGNTDRDCDDLLKLMLKFLLILMGVLFVGGHESREALARPGTRRIILYMFEAHWTV